MQTRQRASAHMGPMISKFYRLRAAESELETKERLEQLLALARAMLADFEGAPPTISEAALEQRRAAGERGRQRRVELGRLGGRPRKGATK